MIHIKRLNEAMQPNAYMGKCVVFGCVDGKLEFGGSFNNERDAKAFIVERMSNQYYDYFNDMDVDDRRGMTLERYIENFFTGKREENILNEWYDENEAEGNPNVWQIAKA